MTQADVAELYIAFFDRAPDPAGLEYWMNSGLTLEQISQSFFDQPETQAKFPDGMKTEEFINEVYEHVLERTPDQAGLDYWKEQLDNGLIPKDKFILAIVNAALDHPGDAKTIEEKTDAGLAYAEAGLNDQSLMFDVIKTAVEDGKEAALQLVKNEAEKEGKPFDFDHFDGMSTQEILDGVGSAVDDLQDALQNGMQDIQGHQDALSTEIQSQLGDRGGMDEQSSDTLNNVAGTLFGNVQTQGTEAIGVATGSNDGTAEAQNSEKAKAQEDHNHTTNDAAAVETASDVQTGMDEFAGMQSGASTSDETAGSGNTGMADDAEADANAAAQQGSDAAEDAMDNAAVESGMQSGASTSDETAGSGNTGMADDAEADANAAAQQGSDAAEDAGVTTANNGGGDNASDGMGSETMQNGSVSTQSDDSEETVGGNSQEGSTSHQNVDEGDLADLHSQIEGHGSDDPDNDDVGSLLASLDSDGQGQNGDDTYYVAEENHQSSSYLDADSDESHTGNATVDSDGDAGLSGVSDHTDEGHFGM